MCARISTKLRAKPRQRRGTLGAAYSQRVRIRFEHGTLVAAFPCFLFHSRALVQKPVQQFVLCVCGGESLGLTQPLRDRLYCTAHPGELVFVAASNLMGSLGLGVIMG